MIKSQVIAGRRNISHQSRILTKSSSLPTLNDLVERQLTLESTAKTTSHFQPTEASRGIAPIKTLWRRPWCNGYRRRKWTQRHEFKCWTRLIAFHIVLIPLGKV